MGKTLAFARSETLPSGGRGAATIEVLDLATNRVSTVPDSQGLRAPSWSPDGRFMAAMAEDYHRLMLFDVRAKKWTELSPGILLNGALKWSRDGAFLYFQDLLAPNQAIYRVRLRDHKREEVINFETYIRAGVPRCGFVDLAPDGSLIATLGSLWRLHPAGT